MSNGARPLTERSVILDYINEFSDERNKVWCVHCSGTLADLKTNRDHVPTKGFLQKPWPNELPVMTICVGCNTSFSRDEQYAVSFLSSVLSGTTDPEKQINASAARAMIDSPALRSMIEQSKQEYQTLGGQTKLIWTPDMIRINKVIVKNARGHAFHEVGEPIMNDPAAVWAHPLALLKSDQLKEFEGGSDGSALAVSPELGSRMMNRLMTGQDFDGGWIIVQDEVYRFSVSQGGGTRVRSVLSNYLATEVFWEHEKPARRLSKTVDESCVSDSKWAVFENTPCRFR